MAVASSIGVYAGRPETRWHEELAPRAAELPHLIVDSRSVGRGYASGTDRWEATPMEADARQPDAKRFSALSEANYCSSSSRCRAPAVANSPQCLRVRTIVPFGYLNAVVCRALPTGAALDALIAETRGYYAAHASRHSWYVTPLTSPADAGETLAARGLVAR